MADTQANNQEIEIALLKQRVETMEKDVLALDSEIKSLRSEMKDGFDKVLDKLDTQRDELVQAKSFGKGVYWVVGALVAGLVAFKDNLVGLLK